MVLTSTVLIAYYDTSHKVTQHCKRNEFIYVREVCFFVIH